MIKDSYLQIIEQERIDEGNRQEMNRMHEIYKLVKSLQKSVDEVVNQHYAEIVKLVGEDGSQHRTLVNLGFTDLDNSKRQLMTTLYNIGATVWKRKEEYQKGTFGNILKRGAGNLATKAGNAAKGAVKGVAGMFDDDPDFSKDRNFVDRRSPAQRAEDERRSAGLGPDGPPKSKGPNPPSGPQRGFHAPTTKKPR